MKPLLLATFLTLSSCATVHNMTPCERARAAIELARESLDAAEEAAGYVCPLVEAGGAPRNRTPI